jgi:hypothetical protein
LGASTTVRRDHSTVCCGIQPIDALRESDPDVDELIVDLRRRLTGDDNNHNSRRQHQYYLSFSHFELSGLEDLAEWIAA